MAAHEALNLSQKGGRADRTLLGGSPNSRLKAVAKLAGLP
jgi:hypothetical protein